MEHDLEAQNMKLLFMFFEQASSLKKISMSEIYYFGEAREEEDKHTKVFGCKSENFSMTYL